MYQKPRARVTLHFSREQVEFSLMFSPKISNFQSHKYEYPKNTKLNGLPHENYDYNDDNHHNSQYSNDHDDRDYEQ